MTFEEHIWNKWDRLNGHNLQKNCFKHGRGMKKPLQMEEQLEQMKGNKEAGRNWEGREEQKQMVNNSSQNYRSLLKPRLNVVINQWYKIFTFMCV